MAGETFMGWDCDTQVKNKQHLLHAKLKYKQLQNFENKLTVSVCVQLYQTISNQIDSKVVFKLSIFQSLYIIELDYYNHTVVA